MKKSTVFEETYNKYMSQISEIDLMPRAERLGAELAGDALIIPYYENPFRISIDGVFDKTGKRANFAISVVLFQYVFSCPAEIPIAGDWVTYREFKDAGPLAGYFTSNTNKIIETTFTGNPEALRYASKRLGGRLLDDDPSWDLSLAFDMLPRIPIHLRFNDKDDEFPAQCSILFRQSAESYIDMESLAIGGTYLIGMLTKGQMADEGRFNMVGHGCDRPLETCLMLGAGAFFYEQNGIGRSISQEEALEILNKGIETGLVLQPSNSQKPSVICMCCGCCCLVLKNLNRLDEPAKVACTNYYATVSEDDCTGCGNCEDICQMGAITVEDESAVVSLSRCIGCGLCVARCEFGATTLVEKEESEKYAIPANTVETFMNMAQERGLV